MSFATYISEIDDIQRKSYRRASPRDQSQFKKEIPEL